ncbi:hypothetical protein FDECE_11066 [Fusarium decemcellulare]|nr:hypothetical protein FDECE_11066 [Fusarium decemcellulare]
MPPSIDQVHAQPMSLQDLPPEILLHIFGWLGSAFFRQDIRRLLVSKRWYQLARTVLLQDLSFSAVTLREFVAAFKAEDAIASLQNYPITARLCFDGFTEADVLRRVTSNPVSERRDEWFVELNNHLTQLAIILGRCSNLESLVIEARPEYRIRQSGFQQRNFLMAVPLTNLTTISHLTCLEIDIPATGPVNQRDAPRIHFCHVIQSMLPTLRRLRCRMNVICPDILDIPQEPPLLDLEHVVINVSISEMSKNSDLLWHPRRCGAGAHSSVLRADMEEKATNLVSRMRKPQFVRILSPAPSVPSICSFDAITGRRMILEPSASWDADGVELTDEDMNEDNARFG